MISENFKYLAKPKRSIWNILGWLTYCIAAFIVSFLVLDVAGFWPGFISVIAFVFGPKIWRRL